MTDADKLRDRAADDAPDPRTVELLEHTFAVRASAAPRAVGLAEYARATRRRRVVRRGAAAAVLAAATVGVAIAVPYALTDRNAPAGTTFTAGLPAVEQAPDGYRWESTLGVEFLVPADWAYGQSGDLTCANLDPAIPTAFGQVGLSRAPSDLVGCEYLPMDAQPPHVWVDSTPAEPETINYGDGLIDEGREVDGVVVSVLSDDPELRSTVLDSLHPVETYDAYGCAPTDPAATEPDHRAPDTGGLPQPADVTSVALCMYLLPSKLDTSPKERPLVTSARFDASLGGELVAAIEAAPVGVGPDDDPANCLDEYGGEIIVAHVGTTDGEHQVYVRDSGCIGNGTDDGTTQRLLTTDVFAALWSAELMRPTYWQMPLDELVHPLYNPPSGGPVN